MVIRTAVLTLITLVLSFVVAAGLVFGQTTTPTPTPTTTVPQGAPSTGMASQ